MLYILYKLFNALTNMSLHSLTYFYQWYIYTEAQLLNNDSTTAIWHRLTRSGHSDITVQHIDSNLTQTDTDKLTATWHRLSDSYLTMWQYDNLTATLSRSVASTFMTLEPRRWFSVMDVSNSGREKIGANSFLVTSTGTVAVETWSG